MIIISCYTFKCTITAPVMVPPKPIQARFRSKDKKKLAILGLLFENHAKKNVDQQNQQKIDPRNFFA